MLTHRKPSFQVEQKSTNFSPGLTLLCIRTIEAIIPCSFDFDLKKRNLKKRKKIIGPCTFFFFFFDGFFFQWDYVTNRYHQKSMNDATKFRIPLVVTFHSNLPPLRNIMNDNHHILHTSGRLQRAVPETPVLAYRHPRNLRDLIVRAKVPPLTDVNSSPIQHGNFRCGTNRCVVCKDHMKEGDTFTSHSTFHLIRGNITCSICRCRISHLLQSMWDCVYLISCRVCGIQYVGEARTTLKRNFHGHRSTVNTKKLDTPVGQHFYLLNRSITDMILQGIESLGTRPDTVHASREKMWMRRLRTIEPHGLNIQEKKKQKQKQTKKKRLTLLFLFQQFSLLRDLAGEVTDLLTVL